MSPSTENIAWGSVPPTPASTETTLQSSVPPEMNGALEKLEGKGKDKEGASVRKFRGVPEDVQLFEVFWKQVVELIKVGLAYDAIAA